MCSPLVVEGGKEMEAVVCSREHQVDHIRRGEFIRQANKPVVHVSLQPPKRGKSIVIRRSSTRMGDVPVHS